MMSQIYIALSFAMLNVLAYHSIGNEGELSNYQVQLQPNTAVVNIYFHMD